MTDEALKEVQRAENELLEAVAQHAETLAGFDHLKEEQALLDRRGILLTDRLTADKARAQEAVRKLQELRRRSVMEARPEWLEL